MIISDTACRLHAYFQGVVVGDGLVDVLVCLSAHQTMSLIAILFSDAVERIVPSRESAHRAHWLSAKMVMHLS